MLFSESSMQDEKSQFEHWKKKNLSAQLQDYVYSNWA